MDKYEPILVVGLHHDRALAEEAARMIAAAGHEGPITVMGFHDPLPDIRTAHEAELEMLQEQVAGMIVRIEKQERLEMTPLERIRPAKDWEQRNRQRPRRKRRR
jgi:hypothetical protein